MKINFSSIKFHFFMSGVLLILPLFASLYFFSLSHELFNQSLRQVIQAERVSNLLSESARHTVDLQRNVLIFKETSSALASDRVRKLVDDAYQNIDSLKNNRVSASQVDDINKTLRLLHEYKDNFLLVKKMRIEREELIALHVDFDFKQYFSNYSQARLSHKWVSQLEHEVLSAQSDSMAYIISLDLDYIDDFNERYEAIEQLILQDSAGERRDALQAAFHKYHKNFTRIVSLTRHYVYLINVVMTGSANEILYLADSLLTYHQDIARDTRLEAIDALKDQKKWGRYLSVIGALLAVFVVILFYRRITAPLDRMANVFRGLAEGERNIDIPDLNRKDEIGLLARSANVFRTKNEQTEDLLTKTENMVEEQRVLNESLRTEKNRAERALSVKTDFLANMSHELRTPLNAIIGFTVRLLKRPDDLAKQQLNALQIVERNGRHLLTLINDVLDLSKIEANKLELNIEQVDVVHLCAELIGQISISADEKGLNLDYDYIDVPAVQTDSVRLSQILLNVLSNAIKYTGEGGVTLQVSKPSLQSVVIKVHDTGAGISEQDLGKLFDRFEQFDDKTRFQIGQGTGLGLSIVSNLAKILRIQIDVDSTVGIGTCFTLTIPLVYVE